MVRKIEKLAGGSPLGYAFTVLCTLIAARVVIDVAQNGAVFNAESWVSPGAWIVPVGFALIACFAYWYRVRP